MFTMKPCTFIGLFFLNCFLSVYTNENSAEFEFNREHVAVLFNPLVAPLGYEADLATTTKDTCTESDIFPLLEKIKTKFNTIAFKTTDKEIWRITYDCIPSSVAKMNRIWVEQGFIPMQVWLVDSVAPIYVQTETDFTGRLENLSAVIHNANNLFPGTVPGIFLDYYSYIHDNSESQAKENAEEHLALSPKILGDGVKTGLVLSNSYCKQLERLSQKGESFLQNSILFKADIVLFADFEAELPSSGSAGKFALETYTTCVDWLISHVEEKEETGPEIGVYTAWTATTPSGVTSYSDFVAVWRTLNSWATQRQRPVLMWGAFDDLPRSNIPWSSLGWWRLLPNSSYVHTSDYRFVEKIDLVEDYGKRTDPMGNFTFWNPSSSKFSRELFGVSLDPFVHFFENGVRGRQVSVRSLLRQVHSRFSKIRVPPIMGDNVHHSIHQLLSFVPKFNSNASNPIELLLTFNISSLAIGKIAFDETLNLASKANMRFTGTVKTIFLDTIVKDGNIMSDTVITEVLEHVREKLEASNDPVQLGAIIYGSSCNVLAGKIDPEGRNSIHGIASISRILYIYYYTPPARLHLGADRVLAELYASFKKCEKRIRSQFPEIQEVGLMTNWHDTDQGKRQNFVQLVNFWEKLNFWAMRTNTKVIINEAVDNPNDGNKDINQGWWRFVENKTLAAAGLIGLEEKKAILPPKMSYLRTVNNGLRHWEIAAICMGIIVLLAFIVVANIYYLRNLKKQVLTKQELDEFFKGSNDETIAYDQAYDVDKLELKREEFTIDDKRKLGSGEFGQVNFGTVYKKSGEPEKSSAVKTIKTGASNTALKGLLSEIKVLSYLGNHENIVSLLGAYTSELKSGKLYVFLELCDLGSLHGYLLNLSDSIDSENKESDGGPSTSDDSYYTNIVAPGDYRNVVSSSTSSKNKVDTSNLPSDFDRWTKEIVRGMEYLASKRVVHADLATRNVLLTSDKRARISDFGLSRRLYNYALYQKTQEEPLPWKWMAPESLRRMEFTEKTDVWAYGVTLWEIYTLGDVPYPGLGWEMDFVNSLDRGLRLDKPFYCDASKYEVMLLCWNSDADKRPTFSDLRKLLSA